MVAEIVLALHATVAGRTRPPGSRRKTVAPVTVLAASGSLNRALTVEPTSTPAAPFAGVVDSTVGAVVSGPGGFTLKTTSTQ